MGNNPTFFTPEKENKIGLSTKIKTAMLKYRGFLRKITRFALVKPPAGITISHANHRVLIRNILGSLSQQP